MKNLRYLATNLSKVGNGLERNFCFSRKEKSGNHFAQKNMRTTQYGIESVSNLGAKIWDLLPRKK